MSSLSPEVPALNAFTRPLIEALSRHPKRIVFTEGEDLRVLKAAAQLVAAEAATPILLGNKERIRALAAENGVKMTFINVIDPAKSSDFDLFCQRVTNMARYRDMQVGDAAEIVARPHYFGALMVQYGQADALVGGNQALPATLFRALIHTIKPIASVPKIFGAMVLVGDHLKHLGGSGVLFLADCALTPRPEIDQLAAIALETGKLAHHFLGRTAHVALLSHSTKGSASTDEARRIVAATAIAKEAAEKQFLDLDIDGELQADVALDPAAAEVKLADAKVRATADVLVFPNLDAAHISLKLLQHVAGAQGYGQLILGLARPAAQVPRTATVETIFGTAAAVGVEAIKYHQIFPDGDL
jgi:phosphate acetyltransferase